MTVVIQARQLVEFGSALRSIRLAQRPQLTIREVARRVGCREIEVLSWEEGASFPTPRQYARLRNMVDGGLRAFRSALDAHWKARNERAIARELGDEETEEQAESPAPPRPEPDAPATVESPAAAAPAEPPALRPQDAAEFGEALRRARELEYLTVDEVAELVGVTQGAVRQWEVCKHMPTASLKQRLMEVFPILDECASTNANGMMAQNIAPPNGGREAKLAKANARAVAKAKDAAAPRASTAAAPPPPPGLVPVPLEEAGAAYARALAAIGAAEAFLSSARSGLERAEAEASRVRKEAEVMATSIVGSAKSLLDQAAASAEQAKTRARVLLEELMRVTGQATR